jgi:uncharacterized membrane protein
MYPAILTPDSYEALRQVIALDTSLYNSAVVTPSSIIFWKIFSINANFLFGIPLIQSFLIYLALFMWNSILLPSKDKKTSFLITGLMYLTPFFGPLAVTIWKDVPYIAITMIGLAVLTKLKANDKNLWSHFFLGGGLLAFGATFRYEGFLVLLVGSILLFACHYLYRKLFGISVYFKFAFIFFVASIISILLSSGFSKITHIDTPGNFYKTQSFFLDLEYVNSNFPETLPLGIKDVLQKISIERNLVGIKSCTDTQNFYSSDFDLNYANDEAKNMPKYWLQALSSNAREALIVSRICRSSSVLPLPLSYIPESGYWPTTGMSPNLLRPERPFVIERFFYPVGWVWSKIWGINGNLIAWPGLHFSIIIIFMIFRLQKRNLFRFGMGNVVMAIPMIFLIARSLILFGTVASQEFRYFAHVYFISIPLLIAFLLNNLRAPNRLG